MIPTFIGSTVLVFTILQMAPGGPIEQMMLELQMGGGVSGEGGGSSSSVSGTVSLPPKALQELKRFYGFDKPIYERYLSWLGVWPREIKHRDLNLPKNISSIEKRVGKVDGQFWKVDIVMSESGTPIVYEKSGEISQNWFSIRPDLGRLDSSAGTILLGKGQGSFNPVSLERSGLAVLGESRNALIADFNHDGRSDIVATQTLGPTHLYLGQTENRGIRLIIDSKVALAKRLGCSVY